MGQQRPQPGAAESLCDASDTSARASDAASGSHRDKLIDTRCRDSRAREVLRDGSWNF